MIEQQGVLVNKKLAEKMEVIKVVEQSALSVKRTLKELGINRSTFYQWYRRYVDYGYDGLLTGNQHREDSGTKYPNR